jgi:hypothetical protein
MVAKLSLLATLAAAAGALAIHAASAAPLAPRGIAEQNSIIHQVQRRCSHWHRECRRRHGGGGDYRRCMRRRDC